MPVHVVVFASEQLVPAISFLVHMWQRHGSNLQGICIHHTHDPQRSCLPALRLRRLLTDLGMVTALRPLSLVGSDGTMAAVRNTLQAWFCAAPGARWVVDATGGTKPMSLAAVEYTLAAEFVADRKAVYLELGAGWGVYEADPVTGLTSLRAPQADDADMPPTDVLERCVPLELLTQTQHADQVTVRSNPLPPALDLLKTCLDAMDHGWRWQVAGASSPGWAFECFIACALWQAGLQRLAWSVQVLLPATRGGTTPMAEVDIVLCRGSTVCCIDVKLPGERAADARSTQLSRALHNARQLGGRAVKCIVLRPGWLPDAAVQQIAAALGVVLLDQSHAASVFTHLLRHIAPGLPLPPPLQQAEDAMAVWHAQRGLPLLSTTDSVFALLDSAVVDFSTTSRAAMDHLQRPWVLVRMAPGAYLLQVCPAHSTWSRPPDRLALRAAVLDVVGRRGGIGSAPRAHRVVRDDAAMLSVELALDRPELSPLAAALDRACHSI